jgi:hypothetical protein
MRLPVLAAAILVVLAGCTSSSEPPKLPDNLLNPPVYAPSTLKDQMGFWTGESGLTHYGINYHLETADAFEKVVAFYEKALTGAEPGESNDDKRKTYHWTPKHFAEGDYVQVTIEKLAGMTKFTISDVVDRNKRGE